MEYRVKLYRLRRNWWRIQERKTRNAKWRDSFAAPFSGPTGKTDAEIYCRKLQADQRERAAS